MLSSKCPMRSASRLFLLATALASSAWAMQSAPVWAKTPINKTESAAPAGGQSGDETFRQLTLFSDVLERTRSDYVDQVTDEKLIESALNGMLGSLDPHSGYMNKKSFQDMQTQTHGEFGGLGIEVTAENGLVKVVSPIDDTPAARAGIQPNDMITHIDSKPVTEMTLNEAVDKMRGQPGTKTTLTLRRGGVTGHPFDITLTRAVIHIQAVRWEPKQDIAYIRVKTFNEQTQPGLDKALAEIDKQMGDKLAGFVLDLRNNPGGLLDQGISVAGTFLPVGREIVSTRGRHKDDNQSFPSKSGDKGRGKPMVVLINGGSASASEIVAGALQDYRRAVVVGTKSFGKGSVQTIIPVPGGGAMRLTTARYYTPSGRSIQQLGIEPDINIPMAKVEELDAGKGVREADLRGALANDTAKLRETDKEKDKARNRKEDEGEDEGGDDKNDKQSKSGKTGEKEEAKDYQLLRAIDVARGIALFSGKPVSTPAAAPLATETQK